MQASTRNQNLESK